MRTITEYLMARLFALICGMGCAARSAATSRAAEVPNGRGPGMLVITNIHDAPRLSFEERGFSIRLINEMTPSRYVELHLNVLHPSGAPGRYHYHTENENIYFILQGDGKLLADGEEFMLKKDDAVFIPPKVHHSVSAVGSIDLVFLEIYAPAHYDYVAID